MLEAKSMFLKAFMMFTFESVGLFANRQNKVCPSLMYYMQH